MSMRIYTMTHKKFTPLSDKLYVPLQSAGSGDVDTVFVRSVGTRRNDAVAGK